MTEYGAATSSPPSTATPSASSNAATLTPADLTSTTPGRGIHGWHNPPVIEILRIGLGFVWLLNLVFIIDPRNHFWSSFSSTALSFAPTTIGGPGLAQFVSAHPLFFSWSIALITVYLTFALLLGITTRLACFAGAFFSAVLIATQFGSTFLFPGGTDVGAHPLYILIYATLVIGGAGKGLSVDQWLRDAWAVRRVDRRPTALRIPFSWTTPMSTRTLASYFVIGTLLSLGIGFGLVTAIPVQPGTASGTSTTGPVSFVNLSVSVDPVNGWPQYTPANFTIPVGRVVITIVDHDAPMNWTGCPCPVSGTVGGMEMINGTAVSLVPAANVAHSFNIPVAGVQVLSPGLSVVQFSVDFTRSGPYLWYCIVPCGVGADPYSTAPMGVSGYMAGTITVT
ncbi:MAG: DoxX family protein [Thermoplasmata archaeon]|nr:DoxX family protein [Thermoplasmata archaeon]